MKHISSFWSKMTAALCGVALISMSFVSCGEAYDDTALTNRVDKLEERVAKLEQQMADQIDNLSVIAAMQDAIAKLQSAVNGNAEEIAALADAVASIRENINTINGNINDINSNLATSIEEISAVIDQLKAKDITLEEAIAKLGLGIVTATPNAETGMYDIVLSDGTVISVLAENDAIKTIEVKAGEDGALYWAIDGEFLTDAEGNKVPVYKAPQIRITEEGVMQVSIDGENWTDTDIVINVDGGISVPEPAPAIFSGVEIDENGEYAYFTMADGTVLKIALVTAEAAPSMDVAFEKGKYFFAAGESKDIKLTMKNVEKYIIVKPEGWKASIAKDGKSMSITAPAEGVGETVGLIQLFTVSVDGKSAITEIKVEIGEPSLEVTIDDEGNFKITVSEAKKNDDTWGGYLMSATALEDGYTLEQVYAEMTEYFDPYYAMTYTDDLSGNILDALYWQDELVPGVEYVVCAVEVVSDGSGIMGSVTPAAFEDMYYDSLTVAAYNVTLTDVNCVTFSFDITSDGIETLYALPTYYDSSYGETLEETLEMVISNLSSYYPDYYNVKLDGGKFSGTYEELYNHVFGYNNTCTPGSDYVIVIVPADNVTVEAAKYITTQIKMPVLDETSAAAVTFSDTTSTTTTISTLLTPNEDCYAYRYAFLDAATITGYETDEAKADYLINRTYKAYTGAATLEDDSLSPSSDYYLIVLAMEADGKSKVYTQKISTTGLQFSTETVEIAEEEVGLDYAKVKITPSADVVSLRVAAISESSYNSTYGAWKGSLETAEQVMALKSNYSVKDQALTEDGIYEFKELDLFANNYIFVVGVDAEGNTTRLAHFIANTAKPFDDNYVATSSATVKDVLFWETDGYSYDDTAAVWSKVSEYTSEGQMNGKQGYFKLDVDWGDIEVETVYLWHGYASDLNDDPFGDAKTIIKKRGASYYVPSLQYEISQGRTSLRVGDYTDDYAQDEFGNYIMEYETQYLYLTYKDVNGKYYPLITVKVDDYANGGNGPLPIVENTLEAIEAVAEDYSDDMDGTMYKIDFTDASGKQVTVFATMPAAYNPVGTYMTSDFATIADCWYGTEDAKTNFVSADMKIAAGENADEYSVIGQATMTDGNIVKFSFTGDLSFY